MFSSVIMQGEFSQPFMKPPHLDQPISTLLLAESEMAFGRTLASNNDGKYEGSLMLSLKEGYVLEYLVFYNYNFEPALEYISIATFSCFL